MHAQHRILLLFDLCIASLRSASNSQLLSSLQQLVSFCLPKLKRSLGHWLVSNSWFEIWSRSPTSASSFFSHLTCIVGHESYRSFSVLLLAMILFVLGPYLSCYFSFSTCDPGRLFSMPPVLHLMWFASPQTKSSLQTFGSLWVCCFFFLGGGCEIELGILLIYD